MWLKIAVKTIRKKYQKKLKKGLTKGFSFGIIIGRLKKGRTKRTLKIKQRRTNKDPTILKRNLINQWTKNASAFELSK